ncbi:Subunit of KEOPS complex (Cgi121BUD32KAE1) [Halapricum desulfuricans]|uniref:Subunit of KEOPS complex (Cgi121BUD32KAE1) n=1 Tax=Halapricum desulfuricans TaxID=2841257 RepID=A0A897NJE2_9EURY|nr:KEOPS complex subunit Pcc1 [Halapricum desulfuricans]QSG12431.1 Subunit of KEOPS complex (Cgi121BUD32KAE1) [Halapricum desulfuricans]
MSQRDPDESQRDSGPTRTLVVRTTHDDAEAIAASVRPDNTDEMATTVEGRTIETELTRETTGGLHSTADDYVVNLHVAAQCITDHDEHDNT